MKAEIRSNSLSFIGEVILYVWFFIVIINMGLQNVFFSPFISFISLIGLVLFSVIIELVLEGHIGIWEETKTKLVLHIFFVGLILFFFLFFSPDQRLWILCLVSLYYIGSTIFRKRK